MWDKLKSRDVRYILIVTFCSATVQTNTIHPRNHKHCSHFHTQNRVFERRTLASRQNIHKGTGRNIIQICVKLQLASNRHAVI